MADRADARKLALPRGLPRGGPKGQALRGILEGLLAVLPPGAALPSERELAERYGLARMTVRNEIERLTAEGLVYRLHGRGTFVAEPPVAQAGALSSFTEDMLARGLAPGSIVRSTGSIKADRFLAATLELAPGDRVFQLDRVRTGDGHPMAIEQAFLPGPRFRGIEDIDFTEMSLFEVLDQAFAVKLATADQRVVAVKISADEARLLDVRAGDPGLRFHTVARDRAGVPVYYAVSLFPGDQYEIDLRQTRD
jgi:GntR family transcriptional regulator